MRIIFAGTPHFSTPSLTRLLESGHEVLGVYTQPDRPSGRGRQYTPSPVKVCAHTHSLPIFQPTTLKDQKEVDRLRSFAPDLLVVVAYGLILPQTVLDIPQLGCINVHASLLPRWRGAAPIQRAIQAGDRVTGVTIMQMEAGLDTGPILHQKHCPIHPLETAGELQDRLSQLGAEALLESLPKWEAGILLPIRQEESQATYATKLDKTETELDWSRPAIELECHVRALTPWPIATTLCGTEILRIWRAEAIPRTIGATPGTIMQHTHFLEVATGEGVLRLTEVQFPSGKRITGQDMINRFSGRLERLGSMS